eukprot:jgi/Mesen1/10185/ME000076S09696
MEAANQKLRSDLQSKAPEEFDIEVLTGGDNAPHVSMDLALGVADLKSAEAVAAAEKAVQGQTIPLLQQTSSHLREADSSGSGSDESDSDEGAGIRIRSHGSVGPSDDRLGRPFAGEGSRDDEHEGAGIAQQLHVTSKSIKHKVKKKPKIELLPS